MTSYSRPRVRLPRSLLWIAAVLLLAVSIAAVGIVHSAPPAARADASQPDFPRLAAWWPGSAPASDIAKRDYVMLGEADAAHPTQDRSAILAANPNIKFMSEGTAREVFYSSGGSTTGDRERLGAIPRSWVLLQVGSTLSQSVTSVSATTLSVATVDAAKFRTGDLVLVDSEYMYVTGVTAGTPGTLTVRRGIGGSTAATHAAGVRVNAAVSCWPNSVSLNMTDSCPDGIATGEFASPSAEKASAWIARRNIGFYRSRKYDGIMVDVSNEWLWFSFGGGGPIRSIGQVGNPNTPVADYNAFDTTWRTGIRKMFTAMRSAEPTAVIIANASASPDLVTAGAYEDRPRVSQGTEYWNQFFFGAMPWPRPNTVQYAAWKNNPNYTTVLIYAPATDYRSIRFALTTTLMSDGYFAHRGGTASSPEKNVLHWYDEYDGGGIGKGYLGQPTGPAVQVGGAWRRDFTGGVALVNPSGGAVTVQLGATFRKIKGTQVPTLNDGSSVTAVTIPSNDGIILVRPTTAPTPPPAPAPPTGTMSVAQGLQQVTSADVDVTSLVDGATEMRVDPGRGTFGAWMPYQSTVRATLYGAPGVKTVRVEYRNSAGTLQLSDIVELLPPLDTTAPVTSTDAVASYTGTATIGLQATDAGGSGVLATYYRLDGGAQVEGTTLSVASVGQHSLEYWSTDGAGNVETHRFASFSVLQPSTTSLSIATRSKTFIRRNLVMSGALTPGQLNDPIIVEIRKPGSAVWEYCSTELASTTFGDWRHTYQPTVRGTYYFRARFVGDDKRLGTTSPIASVSVR